MSNDWQRFDAAQPTEPGSYLVTVSSDNDWGLITDGCFQAEWDFFTAHPKEWTVFMDGDNEVITEWVLWWCSMPAIPESEPDTVTPAKEFLAALAQT